MEKDVYKVVCQECGKGGSTTSVAKGHGAPSISPSMNGHCNSSSDGKHKPKWERIG